MHAEIVTMIGTRIFKCLLQNVLLVPEFQCSLILGSTMDEKGGSPALEMAAVGFEKAVDMF